MSGRAGDAGGGGTADAEVSFRLPTGIGAQTRLILAAGVLAVRAAPRALACYLVLTALGALFPVATAWLMKVLRD